MFYIYLGDMVKKILIFLFVISLALVISTSKEERIVIPTNAIRYRIIANSNEFEDQEEKMLINTEIEPIIGDILKSSSTIEESRINIKKSIPMMENIVGKYNPNYAINYGWNYFPEKIYRGITYQSGNYESLVITLGDGLGDNWWCVLFPPLCLLEAKEENFDDATYSFYLKDVIEKFHS